MKSLLKTKLNRVPMAYKDEIVHCRGIGDMDFLKQFVEFCHKYGEFHPADNNSIEVYTKRSSYIYTCFPNYIRKINRKDNTRVYFKIS